MADLTLTNGTKSMEQCLAIAATNKNNSPFLRLPPELRNKIYELALGVPQIGPLDLERAINWTPNSLELPDHFLSLLSVSRQIHEETRLLPYILNTFEFIHFSKDDRHVDTCNFTLSEQQRGVIKHITLGITGGPLLDSWGGVRKLGYRWFMRLKHTCLKLRDIFPSIQKVHINVHELCPPTPEQKHYWHEGFEYFEGRLRKLMQERYAHCPWETTIAVCDCQNLPVASRRRWRAYCHGC